MNNLPRRLLLLPGVLLLASSWHVRTASAGLEIIAPPNHKRHYTPAPPWIAPSSGPAAETSTLAPEEPPAIVPEAAPSLSLRPFLASHLDKIFAPLGTPAFAQGDLITYVRDSYAQALPATTAARRPSYVLAMAVCDAMIDSIAEREKAVAALSVVYERRKSESIQPRGGKQAVKDSDKDEAFFYESQKNNWLQNAAALRRQVGVLEKREAAAEAQAGGPWAPPPPAPPEGTAAQSTPAVSVPAPETDPVVGNWKWDGYMDVTLNPDHTIGSKRHGTWLLASATDGKRHYEFHYNKHPGWIDQLTLSDDGRSLEGANKDGKYVSAQRR